MTTPLDLTVIVPGTTLARLKGCTCPNTISGYEGPLLGSCGYLFSPMCPVHRNAVLAEVQRTYGRPN